MCHLSSCHLLISPSVKYCYSHLHHYLVLHCLGGLCFVGASPVGTSSNLVSLIVNADVFLSPPNESNPVDRQLGHCRPGKLLEIASNISDSFPIVAGFQTTRNGLGAGTVDYFTLIFLVVINYIIYYFVSDKVFYPFW